MTWFQRHATADPSYWVFTAVAFAAAAVLVVLDEAGDFERFLGSAPALVAMTLAAAGGAIALRHLEIRGWCPRRRAVDRWALVEPAAVAVAFAVLVVFADVAIGFSEDTNVGWPRSILFYPAIALIAEVVFHLVPLALVSAAAGWHFTDRSSRRRVWFAIVVVATVETVFQVADALGDPEPTIAVFVGPHLFAIGAYELLALRRFGFISIVVFRLVYYLLWHIAWGALRLELLF